MEKILENDMFNDLVARWGKDRQLDNEDDILVFLEELNSDRILNDIDFVRLGSMLSIFDISNYE